MIIQFNPGVPLYHQIAQVLRQRLEAGDPGASLMQATEQNLVREFGVSRTTVRQALGKLKQEGLLQSRRGVGTRSMRRDPVRKLVRSSGDPLHAQLESRPRLIGNGEVPAPAAIADFFGIDSGATVFRFVRVHDLDGEPLSVVISYLPADIGAGFTRTELRQPVHELLWKKFGLRQKRSVHRLRLTRADAEVASLLQIGLAEPVLDVHSSVYLPDGKPIRWTDNFFREGRYEYTAEMEWPHPSPAKPVANRASHAPTRPATHSVFTRKK